MPPNIKTPNNAEIDQALKEFESMSGAIPTPKPPAPPDILKPPETFNNTEIDQALKEFTVKSQVEQVQNVSETPKEDSDAPKMVQFVIKYSGGAIKDQRQAEYLLLGCVIFMFALSLYFFFRGGGNNSSQFSPTELEPINDSTPIN